MKRLCLMALSLVLFSFSGFAQEKWFVQGDVIIDYSGMPVPFPDVIGVNQTAYCERNISLQGANTYIIEGTLDLGDYDLTANGANIILTSTGSIVRTENSKAKGVGTNVSGGSGIISGANVYVNGGQIGENVTLNGCTMFSRTDNENATSTMATTIAPNQWNFIGLYDDTDLQAFSSVSNENNRVWALQYDYANGDWGSAYCNYDNTFAIGEGVFVYPEHQTTVPFTVTPTTQDVSITKTIKVTQVFPAHSGGSGNKAINLYYTGWFALANPFVESINVESLISGINSQGSYTLNSQSIQGGCVYTYNGGTWAMRTSGSILPGQGFFLDLLFTENGPVTDENPTVTLQHSWTNSSSKAPSRDFLTVSVATDGYKVPVMFAQNDMATEGYDIYDANKMFGSGSVAEPYLVCNGIELCKEEVSSANYTATMNIKSSESRSVEIVADNIPEGYSLTLLDGAIETEMSEGGVYTTDIAEGENADRFKLLITKNNVSIADVAEVESVRVVNNNRSIRVYGGKSVRTEVYNALGQKVYETSDRAFDLNNVASGAYVLRVQDGKSVNSAKIVVE